MSEVIPDSGELPDYATIGYLPQDGISVSGRSLREEATSAFSVRLSFKVNWMRRKNVSPKWSLKTKNFAT